MVVSQRGIDIDIDARIRRRIKRRSQHTRRVRGSGARDSKADTLRIVLGAVQRVCGVESNDLMSEHVVACCDARWDFDCPAVVVCD